MARSTAIRTVDDITGEPAAETVRFSLDGVEYDIDLSADNADALRTTLDRYIGQGRRTGGRRRPRRTIGGRSARGRADAPAPGPVEPRRDVPTQRDDSTARHDSTARPHDTAVRRETRPRVPQVLFSASP